MNERETLDAKALTLGYMLDAFGDPTVLLANLVAEMGTDLANGELIVNRITDYGRVIVNGVPVEIQIKLTTQSGEMVNPGGPFVPAMLQFPKSLPEDAQVR